MADYSVSVTVNNSGVSTMVDLYGPGGYQNTVMRFSVTFYNVPEGDDYRARATYGNSQKMSNYFNVHDNVYITIDL